MATWYKEYLDSWATNDVEAVASWFTEDIVYEDTTLGHIATGPAEIRQFIKGSFTKAPGMTFEFVSGVDNGHVFAIEWIMQPVALRGCSIGTMRDGKISSQQDYWNGKVFDL